MIIASCNPELNPDCRVRRSRRDLGGGKLKNLGAGVQKCTRGGLRGSLWATMCYYMSCVNIRRKIF